MTMTDQNLPILSRRRIVLGVTGSIACYKAADLASRLTQSGALVDVILSDAAQRFVTPLSFQSLTGRKAFTDADLWGGDAHVLHVGLAHDAGLIVIAPATANTLAKLAHGQADSLLTVTALSSSCPLLLAPAMDGGMYGHPATQANLALLRERGAVVAGPVEGRMASGQIGLGRMLEPLDLVGAVRMVLGRNGPLAGRRVVVTAGGTQEPIDPVRAIYNRSSGKQGFALAQVAIDRGAHVTLISGPTTLATPYGAERLEVTTAEDMRQAVLQAVPAADVLLMAAAVADFRPVQAAGHKIKRDQPKLELRLEATADILAEVQRLRGGPSGRPKVVVGFAAESQELLSNARHKLEAKGLAMIVANDVTAPGAGFSVDTNRVTLLDAGGGVQELPLMTKAEVAEHILDRVQALLRGSP
jgi:phosphopantothenoylcysteine decarboxylase / phosphopantothenate---cysteine ligase